MAKEENKLEGLDLMSFFSPTFHHIELSHIALAYLQRRPGDVEKSMKIR